MILYVLVLASLTKNPAIALGSAGFHLVAIGCRKRNTTYCCVGVCLPKHG